MGGFLHCWPGQRVSWQASSGLKGQRHISSSKPVELGCDERDCDRKKKRKKSRESAKDGGILLELLSCCAPPSVAP